MGKSRHGRTTARKAKQRASTAQEIHSFRVSCAEAKYAEAMAEYEQYVVETEAEFDAEMRVADNNVALGLPAELPEFTIGVLKRTRALDKCSPKQPDKTKIFALYGVTPDPYATAIAESAKKTARALIGAVGPDEFVPFSIDRQEHV